MSDVLVEVGWLIPTLHIFGRSNPTPHFGLILVGRVLRAHQIQSHFGPSDLLPVIVEQTELNLLIVVYYRGSLSSEYSKKHSQLEVN